ncbi:TrmB family transcriptional regulator [Natronorubrum texcoconense]|uniref:Sugar-specific transcriptional regulator TrmB n=1 Tax=Natronorubrum texcoconense TaxID=1095776 RepID=A0A1G9BC71_9EURY|nr:helix-turn-helix domain-containing protein [Natronorubrum texcoconense]SDK37128.1 Sugar-specific transcriptional regulator TrmB [Natronorubrum texcoconense]
MSNAEEAVKTLTELGLTQYEARCFVALTRLSTGTAKEISQVADVPRSRVYDTIERLEKKGLVDVQQTEPREYKAVSVETACRRIREDYDSRINAAENALGQLEEPESRDDEGMWAISQKEHVSERVVTFLEDAEESVHYLLPATEVADQSILDSLQAAADRGVSVYVEVPTEDDHEAFTERIPGADVVVAEDLQSTNEVYSEWPGQLLMVDQRAIVASGVTESDLPDVVHEMAVWTYGRDHGLAVWMRELLDDRIVGRDGSRMPED